MENDARIEQSLETAIARATGRSCPPRLAGAVRYAMFPGGARVRPRLTLAVADACGDTSETMADGAAAAIEMLHCASLVHDDLPCFDDAGLRRGKPSVHCLYGEPLAVLAGDALIVEAFNTATLAGALNPDRLVPMITCIAKAVGMPGGIVAGQAWESEETIDVLEYHHAKTGSLFVGAVCAGAIAAGRDPAPWQTLGQKIGKAYQLADDLLDAMGSSAECGKPVAQDAANAQPNAVDKFGVHGVIRLMKETVDAAADSVPDCEDANGLRTLIISQAKRLVPEKYASEAA